MNSSTTYMYSLRVGKEGRYSNGHGHEEKNLITSIMCFHSFCFKVVV